MTSNATTSQTHRKQKTHQLILESALRLFRKNGIESSGLEQIMKRAGLTVGGFYAHFDSKEALVVEAIETALHESSLRLRSASEKNPSDPIRGMLDVYLSEYHRDHPSTGCALVSLSNDLARRSHGVSKTIEKYLNRWIRFFDRSLNSREESIRRVSMVVGALTLARMTRDTELSDEILRVVRSTPSQTPVHTPSKSQP